MDGAALAGRIAPLEDGHDALAGCLHPELYLDELDLQLRQGFLVFLLAKLLVVGIVIGGKGVVVDPFRRVRIVDVEHPGLAADRKLDRPASRRACSWCLFEGHVPFSR